MFASPTAGHAKWMSASSDKSHSRFRPIYLLYMVVFRRPLVTLETTDLAGAAWATPPDRRASSVLRSTIKSLLIVKRPNLRTSSSLANLTYCSDVFRAAQGQCIYYPRSSWNYISSSLFDPHLRWSHNLLKLFTISTLRVL